MARPAVRSGAAGSHPWRSRSAGPLTSASVDGERRRARTLSVIVWRLAVDGGRADLSDGRPGDRESPPFALFVGVRQQLQRCAAVRGTELVERRGEVAAHGGRIDRESLRDLLRGEALA